MRGKKDETFLLCKPANELARELVGRGRMELMRVLLLAWGVETVRCRMATSHLSHR